MILAIDGYEANAGHRVGVGRYAAELLTAMYTRLGKRKGGFEKVRVYLPRPRKPHMPKQSACWTYEERSPKVFWTFWALPKALRTDKPKADAVFSPTHYIPRFTKIPKVMAIMDLSYLSYPELFRKQDLYKLEHWTAYSARHAKAIITISEFSKNAIIKAYRVPKSRVIVAYPALPKVLPGKTSMNARPKGITGEYILSVGTLQPRKNYERLIEAFAALKKKDIALCIAGKKGWLYDDILSAPARYGVEDRVKFLDFVKDSELPSLYAHAVCFALPSLYEGFGFPVLEAMSYGTQVVVSDTTSLPEIAGEAGIYVDPERTESITRGLEKAVKEYGTERAKKRIAKGRARAKEFTWDKAAAQVLEVIENVAGENAKHTRTSNK